MHANQEPDLSAVQLIAFWGYLALNLFAARMYIRAMVADHTSRLVKSLIQRDMHRAVNKIHYSQQILHLGSSGAPHQEGPVSEPLGAPNGFGYSLEALLHSQGRQIAQRLFLACRCKNYQSGPVVNR